MENVTLVTVQKHIHTQAREIATSGSQKVTRMMQKKNSSMGSGSKDPPSMGVRFISAGLAACAADLVTFPLDTAKVRLQIQGEGSAAVTTATARGSGATLALAQTSALASTAANSFKYQGIIGTLCTISREEGVRAMYNGLVPGLQRQMCFGCVRIGLYDSVKQFYIKIFTGDLDKGAVSGNNVGLRILAGMTTGGAAVLCAQPTDVVKVRLQAAAGKARYGGSMNAYRTIALSEGVRGLWKGTLPNIARNCIVNACELVSYDLIKESIIHRQMLSDNMPCHVVSAFGAGFCTTVVASPVDVVKTRFMNSGSGVYRSASHCAVVMFKEGGAKAFYKGFMPSFVRLGSWNVVMFVSFEQLKRVITNMRAPDASKLKDIQLKTSPSRFI